MVKSSMKSQHTQTGEENYLEEKTKRPELKAKHVQSLAKREAPGCVNRR